MFQEKNIELEIANPAIKHLTKSSLSSTQGARNIRKVIENNLEPVIAEKLLERKNIKKITINKK